MTGTTKSTAAPTYEETEAYLKDGGLGEVMGLVHLAQMRGDEKIQLDTVMAQVFCNLAAEAFRRRSAH